MPARAQQAVQLPEQAREHEVRRGDTLWGLSAFYYTNPLLWPRIFEANRTVIEDPHWIYPGERLMIPGISDTLAVPISVQEGRVAQTAPQGRSRFYREPVRAPSNDVMLAENVVPWLVSPAEYAGAAWIADTMSLDRVGIMTRLADPTRINDRLPSRAHPYSYVYLGLFEAGLPSVGEELLIVGMAGPVEGYGEKLVPLARVRVVEHAGESVVAEVVHQFGEAKAGDRVIRPEATPAFRRGETSALSNGPTGHVVAFLDNDPLKGLDQAFIDLGRDEVRLGDVLDVYLPAEMSGGEMLETSRTARLKVIRTEAETSTVRILSVRNTGLGDGMPVRVTQRVP